MWRSRTNFGLKIVKSQNPNFMYFSNLYDYICLDWGSEACSFTCEHHQVRFVLDWTIYFCFCPEVGFIVLYRWFVHGYIPTTPTILTPPLLEDYSYPNSHVLSHRISWGCRGHDRAGFWSLQYPMTGRIWKPSWPKSFDFPLPIAHITTTTFLFQLTWISYGKCWWLERVTDEGNFGFIVT